MSRTGRTILIVDDDAPIRVLLRSILARAGYVTREAKNGQEALESIAGQKFDAILLDLMMPGISGFDILENMRNTKPEWLRSVIVVTAASDKDVRRVNPDEVFKILRKPFEIDELLRTIEQCISAAE
jgi:two-component system OmpR family response regulator